ncbi:hypothetical protein Scep_017272 [Stephania cephalantha]|uniref:Uncharacterized protein n=1 Tax=Stephania cephalantha TaxID=152367 RepID=A0AAP0IPA0_9MAGN
MKQSKRHADKREKLYGMHDHEARPEIQSTTRHRTAPVHRVTATPSLVGRRRCRCCSPASLPEPRRRLCGSRATPGAGGTARTVRRRAGHRHWSRAARSSASPTLATGSLLVKPAPPLPRMYRAAVCSLRVAASRAATGRAAADRHCYREPRSLACVVSDLPPRWRGRSPELLAAAAGGPSAVSVRAGRPRRGFASTAAAAVAWLDLAPPSWRAGSRRPIVDYLGSLEPFLSILDYYGSFMVYLEASWDDRTYSDF